MKLEITLTDKQAERLLYLYDKRDPNKERTLSQLAETILTDAMRAMYNFYKNEEAL